MSEKKKTFLYIFAASILIAMAFRIFEVVFIGANFYKAPSMEAARILGVAIFPAFISLIFLVRSKTSKPAWACLCIIYIFMAMGK